MLYSQVNCVPLYSISESLFFCLPRLIHLAWRFKRYFACFPFFYLQQSTSLVTPILVQFSGSASAKNGKSRARARPMCGYPANPPTQRTEAHPSIQTWPLGLVLTREQVERRVTEQSSPPDADECGRGYMSLQVTNFSIVTYRDAPPSCAEINYWTTRVKLILWHSPFITYDTY